MYCPRCGNEIKDGSNFCSKCGTPNGVAAVPAKKKGLPGWLIPTAAVAVAAVLGLGLLGGGNDSGAPAADSGSKNPIAAAVSSVSSDTQEGWISQGGKRYYIQNGVKCVGMVELDGDYYCFDEDGALLTNTTYEDENGNLVAVDGEGKVVERIYSAIWGTWSNETYVHGRGGKSSVMQLSQPLEEVTEFDFFLEANGNHGVNVNGDWIIVIRVDGIWVEYPAFELVGGAANQNIKFDKPVTVDAFTAFPTKTGNASYSCNYELRDVKVEYEAGSPMVDLPEMPASKPQSVSATMGSSAPAADPDAWDGIPGAGSSSGSCCGMW